MLAETELRRGPKVLVHINKHTRTQSIYSRKLKEEEKKRTAYKRSKAFSKWEVITVAK